MLIKLIVELLLEKLYIRFQAYNHINSRCLQAFNQTTNRIPQLFLEPNFTKKMPVLQKEFKKHWH